jgi:hypothetical protein
MERVMATVKPHPLQRSWDALLILHWRRDNKCGALANQCKEMLGKYPKELAEEGMLRCSSYMYYTMHVRVWVDTFLHPLGIKLWDIDDNKKVLDWCNASTGLDCETNKKARKWQQESNSKDARAKLHMQQASLSWDLSKLHNRLSNPNQVKATGRKSGRK